MCSLFEEHAAVSKSAMRLEICDSECVFANRDAVSKQLLAGGCDREGCIECAAECEGSGTLLLQAYEENNVGGAAGIKQAMLKQQRQGGGVFPEFTTPLALC